ncbi:LacI family DNA-binding transcriptional regulator [Microbacterium sp. NPDC055903]
MTTSAARSAKRPTVYDVARLAGVSTATVSFTYSKPDRVKPQTRAAVLAAAESLGYVPSASARGLARGKTGALGLYSFDYLLDPQLEISLQEGGDVVAHSLAVPDARLFPLYSDEVQRGVQLECRRNGYALMLGAGNPSELPDVVDVAGRVDGLIAFAGAAPGEALAQVSARLPVVELGGTVRRPGMHTVFVDQRTAMVELVQHVLVSHGARSFLYVGALSTPEFEARYEGFSETLRAAGVAVPPPSASHPGDDPSTVDVIRSVLDGGELPDAVICSTDQEALVAIGALEAAGLRVPGDIIVTGFDGIIAGRLGAMTLTTVRQPMEAVGRVAVQILLEALRGDAAADRHETLPSALWVGSSCGC